MTGICEESWSSISSKDTSYRISLIYALIILSPAIGNLIHINTPWRANTFLFLTYSIFRVQIHTRKWHLDTQTLTSQCKLLRSTWPVKIKKHIFWNTETLTLIIHSQLFLKIIKRKTCKMNFTCLHFLISSSLHCS